MYRDVYMLLLGTLYSSVFTFADPNVINRCLIKEIRLDNDPAHG